MCRCSNTDNPACATPQKPSGQRPRECCHCVAPAWHPASNELLQQHPKMTALHRSPHGASAPKSTILVSLKTNQLAQDCDLIRRQVHLGRIKTTPRVLTVIEVSNLLVAIVSLEDGMRSSGNTRIRHSG